MAFYFPLWKVLSLRKNCDLEIVSEPVDFRVRRSSKLFFMNLSEK